MIMDDFKARRTWAVVGSVHNSEKFAYKVYQFLKSRGYDVFAVDPSGKDVDGDKSFTSLSRLPVIPEAVDMVINPVKGKEYLDEANSLGIKYLWFQPGADSPELVDAAIAYGMIVAYNKCVMVDMK